MPSTYTIGPFSLQHVAPGLTLPQAHALARDLGQAMHEHHINTPERAAAFIAQTSHESLGFFWREEIWGPTAVQRGYWKRRDLGNWLPWHGKGYRGRGYIQITGRANYKAIGKAYGRSFLGKHAADLASPAWAAKSAAWWWEQHGCNELADKHDFSALTKRINGGYNGLAQRKQLHYRAVSVARYLVPRPA